MTHSHPIVDDDRRFIIDPSSRAICYDGDAIIIIQGDHNSELFSFEIPRFVEGHDMSLCDQIKIHFNNTDRRKKNESKDVYPVKNVVVSDDMVVFDWLISGKATKYNGTLSFLIQFCCLEDDGTYSYIWHTDIFTGITIASSYNNSETVMEDFSDILEEWRSQVVGQIELSNKNIQKINEDYNTNIAKLDEGYNTNIAKLTNAVEIADQYIGDYTYKELAFEIKKEDWIVDESGSMLTYYETDVDLSFLNPFNDEHGFYIDAEETYDDSSTVKLRVKNTNAEMKIVPGTDGETLVPIYYLAEYTYNNSLCLEVVPLLSFNGSIKETGGIIKVLEHSGSNGIPPHCKVYKLTKSLGKRISDILDEINGEVV